MTIRFVYFDMGGVLLSFCHDRMCRQMAAVAGVEAAVVKEAIMGGPPRETLQWRMERGDLDADEVFRQFCERVGVTPDRAALFAAASDIFAPIEPTIAVVRNLASARVPLGILSNTNPHDWASVTNGRFPFMRDLFPVAALSYEARAMKPEREIYRYAAERAGVEPEEIFFTDDRADNVAGARAAGFDAAVFESAAQLSEELARRGLLEG